MAVNTTTTIPSTAKKQWPGYLFDFFLIILIAIGVYYRFAWTNWSEGANLHPDEYGLTNTLVQMTVPKSLADYFNTRISPLSPYQKYDMNGKPTQNGPDNAMRWGQWPITILRVMGQLTGNIGYDEIRLMGRQMAALIDTITLLLIFLIGQRVYNYRVGLMAAALSGLAVMQIQQSHFMTVDMYGVVFTALAMYCAVRFAQGTSLIRTQKGYRPTQTGWLWSILFGVSFGMTLASRINLLPLAGMIIVAAFTNIASLKLKSRVDFNAILLWAGVLMVVSGVASFITFRITSPMSFRAVSGDTSVLTLHINPEWFNAMQLASQESNGIGGGPPAEQWAARPAIFFPLQNMVIWGMGLPLGIMSWAGFLWALWQVLRSGRNWQAHLLSLVWVGGYFLFMGTRWVKSIRYFLPIYPFLALLAAWALLELWTKARSEGSTENKQDNLFNSHSARPKLGRQIGVGVLITVVLLGTLAWANAFVQAVYVAGHTRIQATLWMVHHIPSSFQLILNTADGQMGEPVSTPSGLQITSLAPFTQQFIPSESGTLTGLDMPHVSEISSTSGPITGTAQLSVTIARDSDGKQPLTQAMVNVSPMPNQGQRGLEAITNFSPVKLIAGQTYYLIAIPQGRAIINIDRVIISTESWDEGLPVRMQGYDPNSQFYDGVTMEARWYDSPDKLKMYLDVLSKADYVIVPSQRAVWSATRLPQTYPMTLEYYRALFEGQLGFDLIASFNSPLKLGPLYISDLGGTVAWDKKPNLPLFNNNPFAAEEAFSVYDHPPVWIFKKDAGFDINKVAQVLDSVNLANVVVQSPKDSIPYNGPEVWVP